MPQQTINEFNRKNTEFLARNPGARGTERDVTWGFDASRGLYYHVAKGGPKAGQRIYEANTNLSGATDTTPKDTTGIFRSRPQFNQRTGNFDTPFDLNNFLSILAASGIGAGALHAAGVFGGAGGGATAGGAAGVLGPSTPANIAATSASGLVPGSLALNTAAAGVGPFASGAGAAGAAGVLGPSTPANIAATAAAGQVPPMLAATAGGAASGIGTKILQKLMDPKTIAALGLSGAGLTLAGRGGSGGSGGGSEFLTPEMQRYQALSEARFRRSDPLHEAVTQLAFSRLPIQAREGLTLPRVPLP